MGKFFSFNGVATRSEYWGVLLGTVAIGFVSGFVAIGIAASETESIVAVLMGLAFAVMCICTGLVLQLAVSFRRCRDSGLNPLWSFATLIPYIGFITMIVIGCLKSEKA